MREIKQKKDEVSISAPIEQPLDPVEDYAENSPTGETYGVALVETSLLQQMLVEAGLSVPQGQSLSWEKVKNCAESVLLPEIWSPEIQKPSELETIKENARLKDILLNHCLFRFLF